MKDLIHELIPHAPQMGLYVAPNIPDDKVSNALKDYGKTMEAPEVVALYDATLLGSAKDGAVFARDRFIFQNTDLEPAQEIRYEDLVRVEKKRGLLKGAKVLIEVNRGRATFDLSLDCSAHPDAMEFLYRFLHEAMLFPVEVRETETEPPEGTTPGGSDRAAVVEALQQLRRDRHLSDDDYERLVEALG